jgi:hypothetical protein
MDKDDYICKLIISYLATLFLAGKLGFPLPNSARVRIMEGGCPFPDWKWCDNIFFSHSYTWGFVTGVTVTQKFCHINQKLS